ncbi:hypothetical protein ACJX0J_008112, partial [Zea mays]
KEERSEYARDRNYIMLRDRFFIISGLILFGRVAANTPMQTANRRARFRLELHVVGLITGTNLHMLHIFIDEMSDIIELF